MSEVQEFIFHWKIRNFSLCFHKNREILKSPVFTTEKFGGSQWNLEIYPKGYRNEDGGYLSLFLRKEKNDLYTDVSTVSYDLAIVGMRGRDLKIRSGVKDRFEKGMTWGFSQFINLEELNKELKNSSEDVLVIRCRIFSNEKQPTLPEYEACTTIGVEQATFLWELNFPDDSNKQMNARIEFSTKSQYTLQLRELEDEVKISIHQEEDSALPKFIKGKLSIITATGKVLQSVTRDHLFEVNQESDVWEFPAFALDKFRNDGAFALLCEFFASDRIVSESTAGSKTNFGSDICPSLTQDLKNMFLNQIHTDVKFKTAKEVVHAHKSVLAARSPVFSAMFEQDMTESQTSIIEVTDVDSDTLKSFLEFIYTGKVEDFDYEIAKELLLVADKYQVVTLKEKCVSFLKSTLFLKNVCEVLSVADLINHTHLKKTAMNFVAMNSAIVFKLPEWAQLIQNNVKLASEILSSITANYSITPKNITSD